MPVVESTIAPIVSPFVKGCSGSACKYVMYPFKTGKNVRDLTTYTNDLKAKREDMKRTIEYGEPNGLIATHQANNWLERVESKLTGADRIIHRYKNRCTIGCCSPNLWSNYRISKLAADKLIHVRSCIDDMPRHVTVSAKEPPPSAVIIFPIHPVQQIPSRKTITENILNLIKDDTVGMIGIWGTGGVGKTHLLTVINNSFAQDSSSWRMPEGSTDPSLPTEVDDNSSAESRCGCCATLCLCWLRSSRKPSSRTDSSSLPNKKPEGSSEISQMPECSPSVTNKPKDTPSTSSPSNTQDDPSFDYVIFVRASEMRPVETIQSEIVSRLKLNGEGNGTGITQASKIRSFLQDKKFLLLVDNLTEMLDLSSVGIPYPLKTEKGNGKVVFTTLLQNTCDKLNVDKDIHVPSLDETEAQMLFQERVGRDNLYSDPNIGALAKDLVKELSGLPSELVHMGKTMRTKRDPSQWQNAIDAMKTLNDRRNDTHLSLVSFFMNLSLVLRIILS